MKRLTNNDFRFLCRLATVLAVGFLAIFAVISIRRGRLEYEANSVGRRPLIIDNGVTKQLPLEDWISSVAGITTNATAPTGAGDIETTTLTSSGLAQLGGVKNAKNTIRSGKIIVALTNPTGNDNLNPTGLATASQIDVTALSADYTTLTGIMAQPIGTELVLRNADPSYHLRLPSGSGSSSTANRFDLQFIVDLAPYESKTIRMESTGWVIVGSGHAGTESAVYMEVRSVLNVGQLRGGNAYFDQATSGNDINAGDVLTIYYVGSTDQTWTGFLGGTAGRPIVIVNLTQYKLTLANETGSYSGRQLYNPGGVDIVLSGIPTLSAGVSPSTATYMHNGGGWGLVSFSSTENAVPQVFKSSKTTGTLTLTAGAATATVVSGTHCICGDNTAPALVSCPVSGTTMTANGTGTDSITYHCF